MESNPFILTIGRLRAVKGRLSLVNSGLKFEFSSGLGGDIFITRKTFIADHARIKGEKLMLARQCNL